MFSKIFFPIKHIIKINYHILNIFNFSNTFTTL